MTPDVLTHAASQDVARDYPEIPQAAFSKSIQLVKPTGEVLSGAHAVFETLAYNPSKHWLLSAYERIPGFAGTTEAGYRLIAAHRDIFYWITVLLFGQKVEPLRFDVVQSIFQKLIAAIFLIAFISFGVQAPALIGSHGVEPVA